MNDFDYDYVKLEDIPRLLDYARHKGYTVTEVNPKPTARRRAKWRISGATDVDFGEIRLSGYQHRRDNDLWWLQNHLAKELHREMQKEGFTGLPNNAYDDVEILPDGEEWCDEAP